MSGTFRKGHNTEETFTPRESTHWVNNRHKPEWPCFCGYAWPTEANLRKHLAAEHPDVKVTE